jgi:prenyltransferase beta subunit
MEPSSLVVFRLLKTSPVKQADFHSHKKLGLVAPASVDECRWASCSVYDDLDRVQNMQRLPRFKKHKYVARLTLGRNAGRVTKGANGHYDWWIYNSFDPVIASVIVV